MYHFPEEIRKAYESQPIALVYDMLVDGKALPILVSDGFCELVGMNRENAMEWFKKGQFERIHPDDTESKKLIIEITEQDMATAKESFKSQLQNLSANGFKIWLDDFGSGYSSLNMFSHMDVDLIKFDMEFMHQIDDARGANKSILKAMTTIANEMGIHTLAEGIENENQWLFLQNIGCEFSQGYFFHRPEPLEAILYRLDCGQKILPCEVSGK